MDVEDLHSVASGDNRLGDADLLVKFEGTGMHRECPGGASPDRRPYRLVEPRHRAAPATMLERARSVPHRQLGRVACGTVHRTIPVSVKPTHREEFFPLFDRIFRFRIPLPASDA